ncbi:MAG: hypothetical protein Q8K85_10860 [Hyphomicrobium sp.]|nr:hypothetical protein [Hyphomicrobium sp.]
MSISLLLAAGSIAAVTYVGMRDHRAAKAARRGLLDGCAAALDGAQLFHAADSVPRLSGRHHGLEVRVDLICDTLTIRRLPQLWMSTTLIDANAGLPGFAILVRPAGTEFYSLTSRFAHRLETPVGFPDEVLIRGDAEAEPLLDELRATLAGILADPRVKEIAVTPRGLRIIRQASEGKRGDHLLLRQSVFENAAVPRRDLACVLDQLQAIRAITGAYGRARAA